MNIEKGYTMWEMKTIMNLEDKLATKTEEIYNLQHEIYALKCELESVRKGNERLREKLAETKTVLENNVHIEKIDNKEIMTTYGVKEIDLMNYKNEKVEWLIHAEKSTEKWNIYNGTTGAWLAECENENDVKALIKMCLR